MKELAALDTPKGIEEGSRAVLEVEDVVKTYRQGVRANDGVSLRVEAGQVVGLLGPNGAGKTTLVRQLLGLVKPDSGRIEICGVDVVADPRAAKRLCSYQPQAQLPVSALRPVRAIELVGRIRGSSQATARARAVDLLERLELGELTKKRVLDLSGGTARLVAFCAALVAPGRVVVLDEPTNDVDPLRRRTQWALVREVAESGSAVLLVTHNVHEAERAVDRLVILDGGQVVAEGRPSELRRARGNSLRFEAEVGEVEVPAFLTAARRSGRRLVASLAETDVEEAVRWCRANRCEFSIGPVTLEDLYADAVRSGG